MEDSDVLIERFADGKEQVYKTEDEATADIPLVVLVNEGGASASEIVAGSIQDNGRGQVVGAKTYGKGSVQLPQTLSDDRSCVTIARWFTTADRTIDGTGLIPTWQWRSLISNAGKGADPQLDKAIELLGGSGAVARAINQVRSTRTQQRVRSDKRKTPCVARVRWRLTERRARIFYRRSLRGRHYSHRH